MRNAVTMHDGEIKGLVRGSATGTLGENISVLIDKLNFAASSKQQDHLSTMISIGYFIMNNGLIVPMQDLAKRYKELKGLKESCRIESARLLEVLSKHLRLPYTFAGVFREKKYLCTILNATTTNYISVQS